MSEKLALEGGRPSVPEQLVAHDWERFRKANQEEIDAVVAVLKSGHLSISGSLGMPQADAMEEEFAQWVGCKYCLVVNSGTAALHCSVAGLGVEAGDQVILPAETFVASAMAVLHQNAIPVFVDVDPKTHLIDPAKIEEKITERTKAIMAIHLYGMPADMDEINQIAKRHNIKVIEDSAQCYGGLYHDKKSGNLGDAAGFAMTTTKQLMTGEGGLFTTNSKETYDRASMTRLFGESGGMKSKHRVYMSERIGWNYKLPEVNSALARVRLRHVDEYVNATQKNAQHLTERLQSIEGVTCPGVPENRTHTYYIYTVHVDPVPLKMTIEVGKLRDAVMKAVAAENVDVMRWQSVPVPTQPMFQEKLAYGNGSPWNCPGGDVSYEIEDYPSTFAALEKAFVLRRLVPPNDFELMDRYAEAFEKVFGQIDRVVELFDKTETYVPLEERKARLRRPQS